MNVIKIILILSVLFSALSLRAAEFEVMDKFSVNNYSEFRGSVAVITEDLTSPILWVSTSGAAMPVVYVSTAGKVGIGTDALTHKLHVVGESTFTGNAFFGSSITVSAIGGLSAPLTGDSAATKAYVDAALDTCALGAGTAADIRVGASADINCDNMAELGTLPTRTLEVSTDAVTFGVYVSTWLSLVDTDLIAGNIRSGYNIFGKVGVFTSGATAVAGDILSGKTAGVNGAIITGALATQTLDPANEMVNAGYYNATTLSAVDTDLAAGNIKTGITVFGHLGNYTSDADAIAANILSPKTAYVNGVKLTGTIPTQTLSAANETVSADYYNATTLSAVDTDLAVGNIKTGITIFGFTGSYGVLDTGQTTSYSDSFGEDHDYQPAGAQMSYTVNGDNTVTDNKTGLMWRRCSQGQNDDATCSGGAATYTWENALAQCENETTDYSDWRLPNVKELSTLVKYEGSAPYIDQTTFPATVSNWYLTGSTYVVNTAYAESVSFEDGKGSGYNKSVARYVRCVRAGP